MIVYVFECSDCGSSSRHVDGHVDGHEAAALLKAHKCDRSGDSFVCAGCGHKVGALVDDGPLCIRCDLIEYPHPFPVAS